MKIKKGDKVKVITGRDNGKEGEINRTYPKTDQVLIETLNMVKKHVKKNEQMPQGGIIDVPRPIHISNVMLICPNCKKPARVGYQVQDGKKKRVCKRCNKNI
ncbi:MAG: 50S ribosomal protein L24 [Weeksellaceae bacterium]